MVYLHVVMMDKKVVFSPLDTLFVKQENNAHKESRQPFHHENQFYQNILQKCAPDRLQQITK